ncbi:MAG: polymer-forming cytoskeletal protein [Bacteroidales bacterium]|nr:polymer-forming cytoskeletal protein [Bacteroidales bacterium]
METEASCINIIGAGTEIKGDIKTSGDMRIDGKLTGNFSSGQKLVIGQSGIIEGDIKCKDCDISGKVIGNMHVTELLTLKATADVMGDISTNKIVIEPGAQFSGVCKMHQNMQGKQEQTKSKD